MFRLRQFQHFTLTCCATRHHSWRSMFSRTYFQILLIKRITVLGLPWPLTDELGLWLFLNLARQGNRIPALAQPVRRPGLASEQLLLSIISLERFFFQGILRVLLLLGGRLLDRADFSGRALTISHSCFFSSGLLLQIRIFDRQVLLGIVYTPELAVILMNVKFFHVPLGQAF